MKENTAFTTEMLANLVKATSPSYYDDYNCLTCNQYKDGQPPSIGMVHGDDLELGHEPDCPWLAAAVATGWKGQGDG